MKFPGFKRRPPFGKLSRRKRSYEVIRLKNRMRRDAGMYGGRFTSGLVLSEPGRPELYDQWFDFYFPGTDRFTIWNAHIVTARKAFWDEANRIAYTRATAMLTPEEWAKDTKLEFVPAQRSSSGKILTYKLAEHEEMRFNQFDGLTFCEQWQKLEAQIIRDEPPAIYESFKLDRSYVYDIGLRIVLDVDVINQATIETAMDRFFAVGETDWLAVKPVSRERLPVISEDEALATVEFSAPL